MYQIKKGYLSKAFAIQGLLLLPSPHFRMLPLSISTVQQCRLLSYLVAASCYHHPLPHLFVSAHLPYICFCCPPPLPLSNSATPLCLLWPCPLPQPLSVYVVCRHLLLSSSMAISCHPCSSLPYLVPWDDVYINPPYMYGKDPFPSDFVLDL